MTRFLVTGGNGFIGTNLVESLRTAFGTDRLVFIMDTDAPKIELDDREQWFEASILDKQAVADVFSRAAPDVVIHLAAFTSCDPQYVAADYRVNTDGAENIFNACQSHRVGFLVHTSSQFVNQAPGVPASDTEYAPHTLYGESKMVSEQLLRDSRYSFNWCIIRPTNIWGPWHIRYPYEFWKVLRDGKYFHPGKRKVIRSYGYVGNICWQINELIKRRDSAAVSRKVFYVGDQPGDMYHWVNDFSLAIHQKNVRVVPSTFIFLLAVSGSLLQKFRIRFPITLSRYKSMTTDNPAPMDSIFSLLGNPPYTQKEGVQHTIPWLHTFWKKNNI